jgi:hypothetical protein
LATTILNQDPFFIAFSAIEYSRSAMVLYSVFIGVVAWIYWTMAFEGSKQNGRAKFYRVTGASFGFLIWLFVLSENIHFRCLSGWR